MPKEISRRSPPNRPRSANRYFSTDTSQQILLNRYFSTDTSQQILLNRYFSTDTSQRKPPMKETMTFSRTVKGFFFCLTLALLCAAGRPAQANPNAFGINLPWVNYGADFGADPKYPGYGPTYNGAQMQGYLNDMKSKHMNIVRVLALRGSIRPVVQRQLLHRRLSDRLEQYQRLREPRQRRRPCGLCHAV